MARGKLLLRCSEPCNAVDLDSLLMVAQLPFEVRCDAYLILMALESTLRIKLNGKKKKKMGQTHGETLSVLEIIKKTKSLFHSI